MVSSQLYLGFGCASFTKGIFLLARRQRMMLCGVFGLYSAIFFVLVLFFSATMQISTRILDFNWADQATASGLGDITGAGNIWFRAIAFKPFNVFGYYIDIGPVTCDIDFRFEGRLFSSPAPHRLYHLCCSMSLSTDFSAWTMANSRFHGFATGSAS